MSGYWKPGPGLDFDRATVSADHGRIRATGEVFTSHRTDPTAGTLVQLSVHQDAQFAPVLHLSMTVEAACAVLGALKAAIDDATTTGQVPHPTAPIRGNVPSGPTRHAGAA
ncbi:hypothetical protein [Nocardia farcinica]|uniref:hypothetical protein n=1 Tax=Nocardia farcinica TaxID=37329 RepID=UPI0022B9FD33|nr:hypothetical protein [Nocardia farcinica]MCZ9328699.1 hypothetical protein [Nocardia farcinica]